jgi:guanylate kinase
MTIDTSHINGHLVLLMAPMGSGKKMLIDAAKQAFPQVRFLVSCTTRQPRPSEVDGREYYFISRTEFEERIRNEAFVEWAEFGGNLYGTLKSELLTPLQSKQLVLNEIELQGVQQIMALIPKEFRTIVYLDAGDWEVLRARAIRRAPISETELELRHKRYLIERESKVYADVVIENKDGKAHEAEREFVDLVGNIIQSL